MNHSAAALTSHRDNVGRMKHLTKSFGKLALSQITTQRIDEFEAARKRQTKPDPEHPDKEVPRWSVATNNRMVALPRKVLHDSMLWGFLTHAPQGPPSARR